MLSCSVMVLWSQTCSQATLRGSTRIMCLDFASALLHYFLLNISSIMSLLQQQDQWCWLSLKDCYKRTCYRAVYQEKFPFISETFLCKSGHHSVPMQHHIPHDTCFSSTNLSTQIFLEKSEDLVFCQGVTSLSVTYSSFLWAASSQNFPTLDLTISKVAVSLLSQVQQR